MVPVAPLAQATRTSMIDAPGSRFRFMRLTNALQIYEIPADARCSVVSQTNADNNTVQDEHARSTAKTRSVSR